MNGFFDPLPESCVQLNDYPWWRHSVTGLSGSTILIEAVDRGGMSLGVFTFEFPDDGNYSLHDIVYTEAQPSIGTWRSSALNAINHRYTNGNALLWDAILSIGILRVLQCSSQVTLHISHGSLDKDLSKSAAPTELGPGELLTAGRAIGALPCKNSVDPSVPVGEVFTSSMSAVAPVLATATSTSGYYVQNDTNTIYPLHVLNKSATETVALSISESVPADTTDVSDWSMVQLFPGQSLRLSLLPAQVLGVAGTSASAANVGIAGSDGLTTGTL